MNVSPHEPLRKPAQILRDWRTLERRIRSARDEVEVPRLGQRMDALREEYRAATEYVLASYARPPDPSPGD
jgi:hypothetical protein